ncbi:hypothetical protein APHAL10511_002969 [Amanita phalloides]|nr:hypothetical protein APHAL10511_002969 [Amanita phalloides]
MTRVLKEFDDFPRARVHYAPSPECTRVGSVLHVTGNSVEDTSLPQEQWKCVTFLNSLQREPGAEEVKEGTWDAGDRSLSVCFDLRNVGEEPFCQKLKQHLPTIKKLCMHCGPELPRKHPVVEMLTKNTAPEMEIFVLKCGTKCRRTTTDLKPDELFCNSAPRLWSMTVMPGIGILPSTLSQLKQYVVVYRPDERINGFDLHTQLSLMTTSLEDLEIESDTHGKLNWEKRSEIQFQRLRRLTVKDDTNNCEQLLAKITVPASCSIEVTFLTQDCKPASQYAQEVGSLAHQWITKGRDGVTKDRRTVHRSLDTNGGGDELILRIRKASSMQRVWNSTWTFGGRLAAKVCAVVESAERPAKEGCAL